MKQNPKTLFCFLVRGKCIWPVLSLQYFEEREMFYKVKLSEFLYRPGISLFMHCLHLRLVQLGI